MQNDEFDARSRIVHHQSVGGVVARSTKLRQASIILPGQAHAAPFNYDLYSSMAAISRPEKGLASGR
jgi:hypothetical protein